MRTHTEYCKLSKHFMVHHFDLWCLFCTLSNFLIFFFRRRHRALMLGDEAWHTVNVSFHSWMRWRSGLCEGQSTSFTQNRVFIQLTLWIGVLLWMHSKGSSCFLRPEGHTCLYLYPEALLQHSWMAYSSPYSSYNNPVTQPLKLRTIMPILLWLAQKLPLSRLPQARDHIKKHLILHIDFTFLLKLYKYI